MAGLSVVQRSLAELRPDARNPGRHSNMQIGQLARSNALQIFKLAVSLGGTESLASLPASMTHSGVPADVRERMGVLNSTIRVSIGVEHPDDLVADLAQALATA